MGIKTTIYLDFQNNDLTTKDFGIRMTATKREYVEQTVKAKAEVWLGEWYRNRGIGIPYLQTILTGTPDFNIIETVLTSEARSVTYVLEVIQYTYEFNNETAEFSAKLTLLIEGEDNAGPVTTTIPLNLTGGL